MTPARCTGLMRWCDETVRMSDILPPPEPPNPPFVALDLKDGIQLAVSIFNWSCWRVLAMRSALALRMAWVIGLTALSFANIGKAAETPAYGFANAAQEITQLFWLAETAAACGWTSLEGAMRFKAFSVRFLGAHLSTAGKAALISLVSQNGYEDKVRSAAREGAQHNCGSRRWHTGWAAYKAAADEHDHEF